MVVAVAVAVAAAAAVMSAFNSSTGEIEAGGSLVPGQPGLQSLWTARATQINLAWKNQIIITITINK